MRQSIRHEKPLSKTDKHGNNPNKITCNQHVIPCKHLLEWSIDGKMVNVFDIEKQEFKTLPARSPYFCVMRLWDQWTESTMLRTNEDKYQNQIELMRNRDDFILDILVEYYTMLCLRVQVAHKERPHSPSMFLSLSHEYSKSELEENELEVKGGVLIIKGTTEPTSQHSARKVAGIFMSSIFRSWCQKMMRYEWNIYQSDSDDLILSDAFYLNFQKNFHVLPINPRVALIDKRTYEDLEKRGKLSVQFINSIMKKNAVNYYIETLASKNLENK